MIQEFLIVISILLMTLTFGSVFLTQNVLNSQEEGKNIGGLASGIYAINAENVQSLPTLNAAGTQYVGDLTLVPGAKFILISQTTGQGQGNGGTTIAAQGEDGGKSLLNTLSFRVMGMHQSRMEFTNKVLNSKLIFLIKDLNGKWWLFGTKDIPATLQNVEGGLGNLAADPRGVTYTFECSSATEPPEYTGETDNLLVPVPIQADPSTIASTSFRANWNAIAGITNFRVEVSTSPNFVTQVAGSPFAATGTFFNVTGLTASTNYYVRVKAVLGVYESAPSNVQNVLTTA